MDEPQSLKFRILRRIVQLSFFDPRCFLRDFDNISLVTCFGYTAFDYSTPAQATCIILSVDSGIWSALRCHRRCHHRRRRRVACLALPCQRRHFPLVRHLDTASLHAVVCRGVHGSREIEKERETELFQAVDLLLHVFSPLSPLSSDLMWIRTAMYGVESFF